MTGLIVLDSDLNDAGERLCRGCGHPIKEPYDCPNCGKYGMYPAKMETKVLYAQRTPLGYYVFGEKEKARMERRLKNRELTNQLGHIYASLEVFLRIGLKMTQIIRLKIAKEMIREVFSEMENG